METCSLESAEEKNSVMSKLSEIEATVKQTQKEMQEFINFSQANSVAQSEIQSVKSHDSSTFTDSSLATNDSRRLMDYQVGNFLQPFLACKVHIFWEGHKILQNIPLTFDCMYCSQK